MGGCWSSVRVRGKCTSGPADSSSAKMILVSGDLREYSIPVTVSQVLVTESTSSCFVCNSDSLFYDDYIPALQTEEELQPNQIYFLLPNTMLHSRLTASDMAALAVKASVALQNHASAGNGKGIRRRKKAQISPLLLQSCTEVVSDSEKRHPYPHPPVISRSGSVRKLQGLSSKRAKMAVRSFRLRLTTIYEADVF